MAPRAASLLVLAAVSLLSRAEAVATCPTTGSTGPLKCLVGQLGTQAARDADDISVTFTVSTPGNVRGPAVANAPHLRVLTRAVPI
jgi:hypothetical protein